jgi:dihydroneopterin triphosphate diphosphatase
MLKIPESVLVVIYTASAEALLLERADHPGFWQSVTGSKDFADEPLRITCQREVFEETGLQVEVNDFEDWQMQHRYEIYPHWRKRYPAGITHNTEHVFGLRLPKPAPIKIAPGEHLGAQWLPLAHAAERCFSWTNVGALKVAMERV